MFCLGKTSKYFIAIKYFARGAKYCSQHVCLHSCLFVHVYISKTTYPHFTKFSVHVTHGRVSSDGSVFPVLWMTLGFHIMAQIGQNQRRCICLV